MARAFLFFLAFIPLSSSPFLLLLLLFLHVLSVPFFRVPSGRIGRIECAGTLFSSLCPVLWPLLLVRLSGASERASQPTQRSTKATELQLPSDMQMKRQS
jgi:hypothetical protein